MEFDEDFLDFVGPGADRLACLVTMLSRRGLKARILSLAGRRHLLVRLGRGTPRLVLVAHYDRFPGSPGVLDNSAACLALVELAGRIKSSCREGARGLLLFFTDGEEEPARNGPLSQGAFSLGSGLSRTFPHPSPALIVLDVVGRGEQLIISSASTDLLHRGGSTEGRMLASLADLEALARDSARCAGLETPLRLPLPWSDDLGFLLSGIPALALSFLPKAEALSYARALRPSNAPMPERTLLGSAWPRTWDLLHSPDDGLELLEAAALGRVGRLLDALVEH